MKKHVVIIGGGFGGLNAAKTLGRYPDEVEVTLIDKKNHHLFQPLLYQVATAGLSPSDIASPIRHVLSENRNTRVLLDEIKSVDLKNNSLEASGFSMKFDYLIMACGSSHSYFGKNEWEEFAPGLKSLEMAIEIRRRILLAFESAEKEADKEKQKKHLTFVVVGAGPTGVEMAGAICEIAKQTMVKDFRNIKIEDTKVILVEGSQRVLASFHEDLSALALEDLKNLGIEVLLNSMVTNINKDGVEIKMNSKIEFIESKTVIWGAGVQSPAINKTLGIPLDRAGRVIIEKDLSVLNHSNIFVIGDQAHFEEDNGRVLPGLAPVAIQMGEKAAKNILGLIRQEKTKPFQYLDKGQMATIGRKLAIMEFRGFKARGTFAWLSWLFVHIYYLIGFKNRLIVMFQWFWSYVSFTRGSRLITKSEWQKS